MKASEPLIPKRVTRIMLLFMVNIMRRYTAVVQGHDSAGNLVFDAGII